MKNYKLLWLAPILALLSLSLPAPVSGQGGGPVQSTSHYVGPMDAGAITYLTTCPNPTPGQECTDTRVTAFRRKDDANSTTAWMTFLQVTYVWPEVVPIVSAITGSGPATLSIKAPLLALDATAQLDLTVWDGNFEFTPAGSASVSVHWTATNELIQGPVEIGGDGDTMHISTGLSQSRLASATIAVDGVTVPGVDWAQRTRILRSREVHLCISIHPYNC
jgi:hypothetical protein